LPDRADFRPAPYSKTVARRSSVRHLGVDPSAGQNDSAVPSNRGSETRAEGIVQDLKAPYPMVRLLQGDVGSGKTIVAFEAIVIAIANGYQAALMAPTEILAEQHFLNAQRILAPLDYRIAVVRRGIKKAEKQELLEKIASGEIQVVVGT